MRPMHTCTLITNHLVQAIPTSETSATTYNPQLTSDYRRQYYNTSVRYRVPFEILARITLTSYTAGTLYSLTHGLTTRYFSTGRYSSYWLLQKTTLPFPMANPSPTLATTPLSLWKNVRNQN